ncbi:UNVERIFIED_CONTAM: Histone deacetylase [Gekko kuhli]
MLSKSIEQLKQPGSLEESEEELHGEHPMQEERAPSVASSIRDDSSSISLDDRLEQPLGAVKVKEEPRDSDDDIQTQQMESGEKAAFMKQR